MKYHKTITALFFFAFLLGAYQFVFADPPIPRSEFIKMTENALDKMDELQSLLENGTSKMEARRAMSQLDAAMKKYDRYSGRETKEQAQIFINLMMAHYGFSTLVTTGGNVGADLLEYKQKAVDLFMVYKDKK